MTTAMPSTVAKPEISISQRTLATIACCAGSSGLSASGVGLLMDEDVHIERFTVAGEDAGGRLDRVLAARVADMSRSRLKALVLAGQVTVGGRTIRDPNEHVNAGAEIAVTIPPPEPAEPVGEDIPLNIVFEDAEIIVIDKPAGLVVHPAAGHWSGTLVNALIAH